MRTLKLILSMRMLAGCTLTCAMIFGGAQAEARPKARKPPAVRRIAGSAAAADLVVTVTGTYAVQRTTVFRDGPDWICATEQMPYFVSRGRPYEPQTLTAAVQALGTARDFTACREQVRIEGSRKRAGPAGCADDPRIAKLLGELGRHCGR